MTDIPTDHDYLAYSPNPAIPSGDGYTLAIISSHNLTISKANFAVDDKRETAPVEVFAFGDGSAGGRSSGSSSSRKSSSGSKRQIVERVLLKRKGPSESSVVSKANDLFLGSF